jgi:hypothetical protein
VSVHVGTDRWSPPLRGVVAAAVLTGLVGISFLLVPPTPSYDPWAWLLWGRELAEGTLDTREGPAFKPLPVVVTTLLAATGTAAPWLWVGLIRAAALAALWLAFRLGRRLAGGSRLAGAAAALGVALCGGFLGTAAVGAETPLVVALGLAAVEAWHRGRVGWVLACAIGCALLRVEAWPFVAVAGVVCWRRRPDMRATLAAGAVLVGAAWLVPELIGSGDPLRGGARARVPNPGQPALADVPALASLREAVALPLWPLYLGLVALAVEARRAALVPAAAGLAWIAVVAVMAQLGFSGEARYALPGAALIAISGAVGLAGGARRARGLAVLAAVLVGVAVVARADYLVGLRDGQLHQSDMATDLPGAIDAAGGRDAVLACGRPYVGRLRGPLMAYRLHVHKRSIEPDERPRAPGVVFRSALADGEPLTPGVPNGFAMVARSGAWEVWRACRVRDP